MASHHDPLKALGPINWDDVPQDDLKQFMEDIFTESQTVIDSIPAPPSSSNNPPHALSAGRARAKTESAVALSEFSATTTAGPRLSPAAAAQAQKLRKEWKESKLNSKDNPLDMTVYKLAGKDGKGAWFARRSFHQGLSFEKWKLGLEREFTETMKVQGSPGSGNIRGIGAEKRVEHHEVDAAGQLEVFQLSAQFPGPTAPRDFITLLLTSDFSHKVSGETPPLQQYMIVSKPCIHPECPPRQGIIRGQYESVEIIRELPTENRAPTRSLSSVDLSGASGSLRPDSRDAASTGRERHETSSEPGEESPRAVEWLMVTRSDPGGSVPRFLIEKGTPPGIVGDAGKFLKWITPKSLEDFGAGQEQGMSEANASTGELEKKPSDGQPSIPTTPPSNSQRELLQDNEEAPSSSGLYGVITGAFEAASSIVSEGLRRQFASQLGDESYSSSENAGAAEENGGDITPSDTASLRSFASALERSMTEEQKATSLHSEESKLSSNQQQEKELRKLQERRRKLDEKAAKALERIEQRRSGDKEKDQSALDKAREKHEKEIAKQEAKYKREIQKLEQKREQEVRKAEERRKKAAEREEKSNLSLELEKTRVERDVALKQIEILEHQVRELQAQNTMLVAKFGPLNRDRSDSSSARSLMKGSGKASPVLS